MTQLQAFLLTEFCEVPIVLRLAAHSPRWRVMLAAITAQCLTHPVVWHYSIVLAPDQYWLGVQLLETFAVLVEGLWYQYWLRPGFAVAMAWSLLANAASYCLGLLLGAR